MIYTMPIKTIYSTPEERKEYNKIIKSCKRKGQRIRRPEWNFPEWVVSKRYAEEGWETCYPPFQYEYMTRTQYLPFQKYQYETAGTGKPDLFFFKMSQRGIKSKFVEVKSPFDRLNPYQKWFFQEFYFKNRIFECELVVVIEPFAEWDEKESIKPKSYREYPLEREQGEEMYRPPHPKKCIAHYDKYSYYERARARAETKV